MSKVILAISSSLLFSLGCVDSTPEPLPAPNESVVESAATVSWCTPASPTETASRTIWCEKCNKDEAESCARQWANTFAVDECETEISDANADEACEPGWYTGSICVDDTSSGVISRAQVGSDTACGVWPFRHAMWRVTYRVSGDCGFSCRDEI